MSVIRVLLVDDHELLREGLEATLNSLPDIAVVGSVGSVREALAVLAIQRVDVVVTDQSMPEADGLSLLGRTASEYPNVRCIVLTMHEEAYLIDEARRAGASGLVLKRAPSAVLVDTVRRVAAGESCFPEAPADETRRIRALSPREREVLTLVLRECSNVEIAERLHISVQTVETHRKNIFRKTGAKTIVGLVRFAHASGLVEP